MMTPGTRLTDAERKRAMLTPDDAVQKPRAQMPGGDESIRIERILTAYTDSGGDRATAVAILRALADRLELTPLGWTEDGRDRVRPWLPATP